MIILFMALSKSCDNCCERAVRPFTNLRKNFRGFFDMIVAGRRDYALMKEALLVKHV